MERDEIERAGRQHTDSEITVQDHRTHSTKIDDITESRTHPLDRHTDIGTIRRSVGSASAREGNSPTILSRQSTTEKVDSKSERTAEACSHDALPIDRIASRTNSEQYYRPRQSSLPSRRHPSLPVRPSSADRPADENESPTDRAKATDSDRSASSGELAPTNSTPTGSTAGDDESLVIGRPPDGRPSTHRRREREAWQLARRAVQTFGPSSGDTDSRRDLPRASSCSDAFVGKQAPPIVSRVIDSRGETLAPAIRKPMESLVGVSLSDVDIHTGPMASRAASSVGASAFTVGSDVVLDVDESVGSALSQATDPAQIDDGMCAVLAHELTHVTQHRSRSQLMPVDGPGALRVVDRMDPNAAISPVIQRAYRKLETIVVDEIIRQNWEEGRISAIMGFLKKLHWRIARKVVERNWDVYRIAESVQGLNQLRWEVAEKVIDADWSADRINKSVIALNEVDFRIANVVVKADWDHNRIVATVQELKRLDQDVARKVVEADWNPDRIAASVQGLNQLQWSVASTVVERNWEVDRITASADGLKQLDPKVAKVVVNNDWSSSKIDQMKSVFCSLQPEISIELVRHEWAKPRILQSEQTLKAMDQSVAVEMIRQEYSPHRLRERSQITATTDPRSAREMIRQQWGPERMQASIHALDGVPTDIRVEMIRGNWSLHDVTRAEPAITHLIHQNIPQDQIKYFLQHHGTADSLLQAAERRGFDRYPMLPQPPRAQERDLLRQNYDDEHANTFVRHLMENYSAEDRDRIARSIRSTQSGETRRWLRGVPTAVVEREWSAADIESMAEALYVLEQNESTSILTRQPDLTAEETKRAANQLRALSMEQIETLLAKEKPAFLEAVNAFTEAEWSDETIQKVYTALGEFDLDGSKRMGVFSALQENEHGITGADSMPVVHALRDLWWHASLSVDDLVVLAAKATPTEITNAASDPSSKALTALLNRLRQGNTSM